MNLFALSQRIRDLRRQHGFTLEKLASATGLTQSNLSKVENFRVTPSLPALGRIAAALGITVSDLLDGLDARPGIVVVRKQDRQPVERDRPHSAIRYYALASERRAKSMDPFLLKVPPGEPRKEALPHEGEEFLMVLKGKIELEYDGKRHALRNGDCAYFDAARDHRILNPSTTEAEVLCVFS